jgi:integrase
MPAIRLFSPGDDAAHTVPSVVDAYLAELQKRVTAGRHDPEAFATCARSLDRFKRAYPHCVEDCKQTDLRDWLDANPGWVSGHTKLRNIGYILSAFKWASNPEEGALIDRCPYVRPKCLRDTPCPPRRPADHSEYVALMRFGSRPLRRALFFLRRTGVRTIEMREVVWDELHLDGPSPCIIRRKNKTRKKTGKPRKIGLDVATANFLRALKRHRSQLCENVFTNCDGLPWKRGTFCQHLRRHALSLGLDADAESRVTAYCLRHTYA